MNIYRWIKTITAGTALAAGVAVCAPVGADTLSEALIAAYKSSNLLDQRRALLRAADEDVVQAAATLMPVIRFVGSGGFTSPATLDNWNANATLSATLTLYDNGRTRYATDAAKETVLGLRGALLQIEQQVLFSAIQAYMEVIRAAQSVSLAQSNVRVITQELRAARDRFAVGEVTRTDVAIAEARLASSRSNLAAAQGDLEIAREEYKAIVGHYPGNLRWPVTPAMTARTEDAAKAFAVRNHPSIEEAQHNVNATEANILRAKAAMGPSVTGSTSLTLSEGFTDTFNAGVEVTVPIYSGGALKSALRQAVARRDAARALLLQSVVDVRKNVGTAWANLSVSSARVEASRRQVRASRVAYEGVREEAKFGARTTLDVLNAEQELLDARSALISAEVQRYVSLYSLFAAMGLLTADKLQLGIVTYDPVEYYKYATSNGPARMTSKRGRALDRVLERLGSKKP